MNQQILDQLQQFLLNHKQQVRQLLEPYHLYLGQPRILKTIQKHPNCTQQVLVNELQLTKETVSASVRRLEKAGFVKRQEHELDKRKVQLKLTTKAITSLAEVDKQLEKLNHQLLHGLTNDEKELFLYVLETMNHKMGEKHD